MKRLTLSLLLVVVVAVIGLGWLIDQWYSAQQNPQEDEIVKEYRQLGKQLVNLIQLTGTDEKALQQWASASQGQVQLLSYTEFPLPENLKKNFESGEALLLDSANALSLHYYLPQQNTVISFNFANKKNNEKDATLSWLLTFLFYSGVIFIVLIWLYPLLARLKLLRASAQAFGSGDLTIRIEKGSVSYISDIEQEFNRMAQKIENLISDNKLLSRGLSHDLRTPLARLRFGLDVLEEAALTESQQKTLAHLNRDLLAMESLVEILLKYARLEQSHIVFKAEKLDLYEILTTVTDSFYRDSVQVVLAGPAVKPTIEADAEYISMLLHNLLQNAERHGNGKIIATVTACNNGVTLSVEDNGLGIPLAEREHVLKPFYRAKVSQNTQGHGMGLAIVDRIAKWHKADVQLSDSEILGGLKISIIFPLLFF